MEAADIVDQLRKLEMKQVECEKARQPKNTGIAIDTDPPAREWQECSYRIDELQRDLRDAFRREAAP